MKIFLSFLGFVSLALGIIGAFLPLLPTTPFVLLSAYLFARSSPRMHNWIMQHKIFGKLIHDFQTHKVIPLHAKIIAISSMWISLSYTAFTIASHKLWLQIILFAIAIGVSIHISRYKTKSD
ncbi:MAG: hypothetical protein AUK44_00180 [Porphyromonadaceae bacterium CG2_30_38_12]|nr:MAG: hypothetical protein AUK44_00180 [Porphyromonadaceae bacterium CG2_30_38_12]